MFRFLAHTIAQTAAEQATGFGFVEVDERGVASSKRRRA
jgi:hypothetical protein